MKPTMITLVCLLLAAIAACAPAPTPAPTPIPIATLVEQAVATRLAAASSSSAPSAQPVKASSSSSSSAVPSSASSSTALSAPSSSVSSSTARSLQSSSLSSAASQTAASSSSTAPGAPALMLIARHSQRCLTATGNSIEQADCRGSDNQLWQIEKSGSENLIVLKGGRGCLSLSGGSPALTGDLALSGCGNATRWRLIPQGGWFQIATPDTSICIDGRQWDSTTYFQWHCKPQPGDAELDNQLFVQSSSAAVPASVAAPPGVYVTAISFDFVQPARMKKEYIFHVTFDNTTGRDQPLKWFMFIYQGKPKPFGQTPQKQEVIPPGISVHDSLLWTVGAVDADFSVKAFWWRDPGEPHEVPFRDPRGAQPELKFHVLVP